MKNHVKDTPIYTITIRYDEKDSNKRRYEGLVKEHLQILRRYKVLALYTIDSRTYWCCDNKRTIISKVLRLMDNRTKKIVVGVVKIEYSYYPYAEGAHLHVYIYGEEPKDEPYIEAYEKISLKAYVEQEIESLRLEYLFR